MPIRTEPPAPDASAPARPLRLVTHGSPEAVARLFEDLERLLVRAVMEESRGGQSGDSLPAHLPLMLPMSRTLAALRWALATGDATFLGKLDEDTRAYLNKSEGERATFAGREIEGGDVIERRQHQLGVLCSGLRDLLAVGRTKQPEQPETSCGALAKHFLMVVTFAPKGGLTAQLTEDGIHPLWNSKEGARWGDLRLQKALETKIERAFRRELATIESRLRSDQELAHVLASQDTAERLVVVGLRAMGLRREAAKDLFDFERNRTKRKKK